MTGLDLRVPAGSIFGFLGRNGAGKTTTIRLLLQLLRPDSGTASVFGLPVQEPGNGIKIRSRIGFVTEDKELYPFMTVDQVIRFTRPASFREMAGRSGSRISANVRAAPQNRNIADLSKGMRSKLMLLLAISHGAELLILDEPTDGLDPAAVEDLLRELVSIAAANGMTVFFSSHQLAEVEQIADHVCIVDRGAAIVAGQLDDLKARYRRLRIVLDREPGGPIQWVQGVKQMHREGRIISLLVDRNIDAVVEQAHSLPGASIEQFPLSLKDIFLEHVRSN